MAEDQDNTLPGAPPAVIIAAFRRLLAPLLRLAMHFGLTFPLLSNLLKSVYVEVADQHFSLHGDKRQSDSRVSLITGVHRKDVRRLRSEAEDDSARHVPLGAQIVARWMAEPRFSDAQGQPRPLPRQAGAGSEASFDELVEMVCKGDLRSRVVLDELLRLGVVHINTAEQVVLSEVAFLPRKGLDDKAFYLGKNIHDHLASISANIIATEQGSEAPFMERCVYYDQLSPQSVSELQQLARELGTQALTSLNQRARALQTRDAVASEGQDQPTQHINMGVYFYHADNADLTATDGEDSNHEA